MNKSKIDEGWEIEISRSEIEDQWFVTAELDVVITFDFPSSMSLEEVEKAAEKGLAEFERKNFTQ